MSAIFTEDAPAAIGSYSQARKVGLLLFVSGQLPIDPTTGSFSSEEAGGQMTQCMANIAAIARAAGSTLDDVVKTTILVTDLGAFDAINAAYSAALKAPYPARACYEVAALPKDAKVEVEAVIALKG